MKNLSYLFAILFFAFAFQSCKTSEKTVNPKDSVTEAPTDATDVATDETPVLSDTSVERTLFASIERTPCFGRCATYKMNVYADGRVEMNGIRDVEMIGKYTTTITKSQMNALRKKAEEIEFFTFEDKYDDPMVTDLPSTTVAVIDSNGKLKSVMYRYKYPQRIKLLAEMFDTFMTSQQWTSETGEIYPPER